MREQSREPFPAIRQNVRLDGKGPAAGTAQSQARVEIAPLDRDRGRFRLRAFGRGERAFEIAVQALFEFRRLAGKALGEMPLQKCPQMQWLESASDEEPAFPNRPFPLPDKGQGLR